MKMIFTITPEFACSEFVKVYLLEISVKYLCVLYHNPLNFVMYFMGHPIYQRGHMRKFFVFFFLRKNYSSSSTFIK